MADFFIRVEDEYLSFSSISSNKSIIFFNKAPFLIYLYLHALYYHLANRDQIFRDGREMQDVLDIGLFVIVLKQDISDISMGISQLL